jgi:hypothetical protein
MSLAERLQLEFGNRMDDLRVEIADDGVVLHGLAPSFFVKQLVQERVMQSCPRPLRANLIRVSPRNVAVADRTGPFLS